MSALNGIKINLKDGVVPAKSAISKLGRDKARGIFNESEEESHDSEEWEDDVQELTVKAKIKKAQEHWSREAKKLHEKALNECPDLFDYDKVYEQTKREKEIRERKQQGLDENGEYKPKYVNSIFSATAKRKLELERIEIINARNRRELEKNAVGEVEEFITPAYKRKLEEIERLEAEERRLEELKKKAPYSEDLLAFYKGILDRRTKEAHDITLGAINDSSEDNNYISDDLSPPGNEQMRDRNVELNDSEEVVDKTQLLKGGLNITGKAMRRELRKQKVQNRARELHQSADCASQTDRGAHHSFRNTANIRRDIIKQRKEAMEKERKGKLEEISRLKESLASRFTDKDIMSAKERYDARKKLRQADSGESD